MMKNKISDLNNYILKSSDFFGLESKNHGISEIV